MSVNLFHDHRLLCTNHRSGRTVEVCGRNTHELWANCLHYFEPDIISEIGPSHGPREFEEYMNNSFQDWSFKYQGPEKNSLQKNASALFASALMAASPVGGSQGMHENTVGNQPQSTPKVEKRWTPDGLDSELIPIAHLESSFGQNTNHAKNPGGPWKTAFGALGFKPETAYEEYLRSTQLKGRYPQAVDKDTFLTTFTTDPSFYNRVASQHFRYLRRNHGSDDKAAYAWRWGNTAAAQAPDAKWKSDEYVQKYNDLHAKHVDSKHNLIKSEGINYNYFIHDEQPNVEAWVGNRMVGNAIFRPNHTTGGLTAWELHVHPDHRGKGLGVAMYQHAAQKSGLGITPSSFQTPDGKKFWSKWGSVIPSPAAPAPIQKSVEDIKPGQDMWANKGKYREQKRQDFTHLLPQELQQKGYKLETVSKGLSQDREVGLGEGFTGVYANLSVDPLKFDHNAVTDYHRTYSGPNAATRRNRPQVGHVDGIIGPSGLLEIGEAHVDMNHRGKKGIPLYEALFRFAHDKFNTTHVKGSEHSKLAHRVHAALARKHGFKYIPEPNFGPDSAFFETRKDWLKFIIQSNGEFDMAYKPYQYKITKNEENEELNLNRDLVLDMHGFSMFDSPEIHGARFLSGSKAIPHLEAYRKARLHYGDDREAVALACFGLPVSEVNRKALRGVLSVSDMKKADGHQSGNHAQSEVKAPVESDGAWLANIIEKSLRSGNYVEASLGGKHSGGSLIVETPEQGTWLLKPDAGGASPAIGASQESANATNREAAFYHIAKTVGIEEIAHTELVAVNNKTYAAIKMLPYTWRSVVRVEQQDKTLFMDALRRYHALGMLHKWAILDYFCGNPDRHGNNMMINTDEKSIVLIDHGSAFAGGDFQPERDQNSFTPFYLRAWANREAWPNMSPEDKVAFMPKLGANGDAVLRAWVNTIDANAIAVICSSYDINPAPTIERLSVIKSIHPDLSMSEAVCKLWITPKG